VRLYFLDTKRARDLHRELNELIYNQHLAQMETVPNRIRAVIIRVRSSLEYGFRTRIRKAETSYERTHKDCANPHRDGRNLCFKIRGEGGRPGGFTYPGGHPNFLFWGARRQRSGAACPEGCKGRCNSLLPPVQPRRSSESGGGNYSDDLEE
jgi:hypothetical protein